MARPLHPGQCKPTLVLRLDAPASKLPTMSPHVIIPRRLESLARPSRYFTRLACAWLLSAGALLATDISGTYADKGVVVHSAADQKTPETISFHGLLSQEFDPQLAALDFDGTDHFTLDDNGEVLATEIFDHSGKRLWRFVWGASRGFSHNEGKAVIRMKLGKSETERCVLVLEPTSDQRALEVKVYKVGPGTFGPRSEPIGTYLFVRAS